MPKTSSDLVTDTATESITIERTPGAVKCNAHNISDSGNDSTANISQHDKTLTIPTIFCVVRGSVTMQIMTLLRLGDVACSCNTATCKPKPSLFTPAW